MGPGPAAPLRRAALTPFERRCGFGYVLPRRLSHDPPHDLLNDAQREAALHGDGPLLVLAGAGSGKTRVIVHRVAHLVRGLGVAPWHVLCVTFTNKAAGEMGERLEQLLGPEALQCWVSTFHAFGARFVRREAAAAGLSSSFPTYDGVSWC